MNAAPDNPPPFFQEMADRFLSRQSNQFLLSGNVSDQVEGLGVLCPADAPEHPARYGYLDDYIATRLRQRGRLVITYNIARGISLRDAERYSELREWYAKGDIAGVLEGDKERERRAMRFDRAVAESQVYSFMTLRFLDEICRLARTRREGPVAAGITLIIKHADTLLPNAPLAQMSDTDRQKLTLITEWPAWTRSSWSRRRRPASTNRCACCRT